MYIERIMHTDLVTARPETSLVQASKLIKEKKIDHLLVVNKKGKLVGLVSDRDLKQHWASPATALSAHELTYLLEKVELGMIMVKTVITVGPDTTIERAAFIMQSNNISALPVMEENELVGIITSTDVIGVLLQAIGMNDDSVRLSIFVKDSIGALADVTAVLKKEAINIQSLFCWPTRKYPGVIQVVLRVSGIDGPRALSALEQQGFKVINRYQKDISEFIPV